MLELTNLFRASNIGQMKLKNRIVMLPITTGYNEADETVGERFIDYFRERAKGGVGLIVIPFSPIYTACPMQPGLYSDFFVQGASRLCKAVQAYEAKVCAQLIVQYHFVTEGGSVPEVVAPSPVLNRMMGCTPRELSIQEIHYLAKEYGKAAHRARTAGFDSVELPIVGGYILNRFLSPYSNKRRDVYGGNLQNRMRIVLEIIENIKTMAGEDYPIICRLNVQENIEGGYDIHQSKEIAAMLEAAGIHAISVYTGWHESPVPTVQACVPEGAFVYLADEIKKVVGIPVIAANRINNPISAERILSEGKADLVGMGRALLADPEFPNKARKGEFDEIVPCIACSRCLAEILSAYRKWGKPVSTYCSVNPRLGQERESVLQRADKPKKVLVVGGGPAGMEAAVTAALRGHKVTLYEKGRALGGQLLIACLPPYKDEIKALIKSMSVKTHKSGVKVKLNAEVGPEIVQKEKPDSVILACGGIPLIPHIPGLLGRHVGTAEEVLTGGKEAKGAVVILGGGLVGCETAEFLIKKNGVTGVTILEALDRIGNDMSLTNRGFTLSRLRSLGIEMETNVIVEAITGEGVRVSKGGAGMTFRADTVVLAVGFRANNQLAEDLKDMKFFQLSSAGDCNEPRTIREAINEGFCIGRRI